MSRSGTGDSASRPLQGRRVLITGASSGVGLAAARQFIDAGAHVALFARRSDTIAAGLGPRAAAARLVAVDVADRDAVEAAVATAAGQLGGLDVVVANAAVASFGHLLEVHPDDFERAVAVTFLGTVNVVRAALPHLRASRGTIVTTGSLNARVPLPGWNAYAASKHAIRGFLHTLALEEREQRTGVRVTLVHPGPIDTPLWGQASSGTGLRPRVPPDSYHPEVVAAALLRGAVAPQREVVLGGLTRAIDRLFLHARPAAELLLTAVDRWYRSGVEPAFPPGTLWRPSDGGRTSGGIPARGSLFATWQIGPRQLRAVGAPALDLQAPLRFLVHGMCAVPAAFRARRRLLHPVPERPAPRHSLREEVEERAGG